MSRWDSLKPSKDAEHQASRFSNVGRSTKRNTKDDSARKWKTTQRLYSEASSKHRNPLSTLKDQVAYYKEGSKKFDPSLVEAALRQVPRASSQQRNEAVVCLATLLEVEHSSIQHSTTRKLELLLQHEEQPLPRESARTCIHILSRVCMRPESETTPISVRCLANMASQEAKQFPGEEMARDVIGRVLIPKGLDTDSNDDSTKICVCQAMSALLQHSGHASALLAPLVSDVSPEGKEQSVANPLRSLLFSALQSTLLSPNENEEVKSSVCQTLAHAIDALHSDTNDRLPLVNDLDLPGLEDFMSRTLLRSPYTHVLFKPSVVLLRAMLQRDPKGMIRFGSQLLLVVPRIGARPSMEGRSCPICSGDVDNCGAVLAAMHGGASFKVDHAARSLATNCVADVVDILPWKLWMQDGAKRTRMVSGFHRKVIESLALLLSIIRCSYLQNNEVLTEASARLCDNVFMAICWNDDVVLEAGVLLWSTLATSSLNLSKSRPLTVQVLVTSMGGRVTPQGKLLPMCTPAQAWLSRDGSLSFLQTCFRSIQFAAEGSEYSLQVVAAVLRTRPQTATALWGSFSDLLSPLPDQEDPSIQTLTLLEAFMLGRRDFGESNEDSSLSSVICNLTFTVLEKNMGKGTPQVLCICFSIYSAMMEREWSFLYEEKGRLQRHFECLLAGCHHGNGKVRTSACKATGSFCSHFFSSAIHHGTTNREVNVYLQGLVIQVCDTMTKVLGDTNASVKSMALFTLGNLAISLRDSFPETLPYSTVLGIASGICRFLDDTNDKVAGNAVRSVGHWGYLLSLADSGHEGEHGTERLSSILTSLSVKVSRVLVVCNGDARGSLSWKQRSAAKKHAWGACNSMAQIFRSLKELDDATLVQACVDAVRELIGCIEKASLVAEKVVVSAMVALREFNPSQLSEMTSKSGLVGRGLASCVLLLQEPSQRSGISSKVLEEAPLLLRHFLDSAAISDAAVALRYEDFTATSLRFLYTWMVDQDDFDGQAFEVFALALQRPGLGSTHDVSLEQHFASRALQQYKKEQKLSLTEDMDDGDADEL